MQMPNQIRNRRLFLREKYPEDYSSVAKIAKKAGIAPRMAWKIEAGDSVGLKYYKAYIEALGGSIDVRFPSEDGD